MYDTSPVDSILHYKGDTSNSPATVTLHSAYEGSFKLESSVMSPIIDRGNAEDPSGKGRRRTIDIHRTGRSIASGEIYWGSAKKETGNVVIRTSNSPAKIRL